MSVKLIGKTISALMSILESEAARREEKLVAHGGKAEQTLSDLEAFHKRERAEVETRIAEGAIKLYKKLEEVKSVQKGLK